MKSSSLGPSILLLALDTDDRGAFRLEAGVLDANDRADLLNSGLGGPSRGGDVISCLVLPLDLAGLSRLRSNEPADEDEDDDEDAAELSLSLSHRSTTSSFLLLVLGFALLLVLVLTLTLLFLDDAASSLDRLFVVTTSRSTIKSTSESEPDSDPPSLSSSCCTCPLAFFFRPPRCPLTNAGDAALFCDMDAADRPLPSSGAIQLSSLLQTFPFPPPPLPRISSL